MSKARTKAPNRLVDKGRGRTSARDRNRVARAKERSRADRRRRIAMIGVPVLVVAVVVALFLVYQGAQRRPDSAAGGSGYQHVEGEPGAGEVALDFTLISSTGATVKLADFRGQSVLLYFQEGLMCQPCWDQLTDLEANAAAVKSAGIDTVVSISHDPVDQLARKVADENLSTLALSDSTQQAIRAYDAHKYGMMREQTAGHSFILVGPDGTIQWRADYGGAPDYTMFLPTASLLADLAMERAR